DRQPAVKPVRQPRQQARQAFVDANRLGRGGQLDQRAVEVEEQRCVFEQVGRRIGGRGGRRFGHTLPLACRERNVNPSGRFSSPETKEGAILADRALPVFV